MGFLETLFDSDNIANTIMVRQRKSRALSAKQVREFLQESNAAIDPELTERYIYDVYNLPNGRIFAVFEDGRGREYISREAFLSVLEILEEERENDDAVSLPAKRVRRLLENEPGWIQDPELSKEFYSGYIYYKNSDGRIMQVFEDGGALLYKSGARPPRPGETIHPLKGCLPKGKNFVNEIPSLIEDLARKLSIPRQELDKTMDSLERVDRAVRRKGRRKCLEPEIFPSLIAYIGEVIRQATDGSWELRLDNEHGEEIWEPWIVAPNGKAEAPYHFLYDELYEGQTCYIKNAVESAVRALLKEDSFNLYSVEPSEFSIGAIDIVIDDYEREAPALSPQPSLDIGNSLPSEAHDRAKTWLLHSIQYYRQLGFFQRYNHLSEAQLAADIEMLKEEFEETFEVFDQLNDFLWEFYPEALGEAFDFPHKDLDLYLLRWDTSRTWTESQDSHVCPENEEYLRAFERWAEISRGAFLPEDMEETWETETGPISVEFTLNRVRHQVEPEYYEEWMDLDILTEINHLIATTGYHFEVCEAIDIKLVVVLAEEEKQKIQRERGLEFERWGEG